MESALLNRNPSLNALIADVEKVTGSKALDIRRLKGSGNDTFLIAAEPYSLVLRLNGDTGYLGVDRVKERDILEFIKAQSICPPLSIWNEDYLVLRYEQHLVNPELSEVARKLSELHKLGVPSTLIEKPVWNPPTTIDDYLTLAPHLKSVVQAASIPLKAFDWTSLDYGLCHADLNPHNILGTADGVRFIDWEYGRYGPCAYDIAVFLHSHNMDAKASVKFMNAYSGGKTSASLKQGVKKCLLAYRLIEALWLHLTDAETYPTHKVEAIINRP